MRKLTDEEYRTEIARQARALVASGFKSRVQIEEALTDVFYDADDQASLRAFAQDCLEQAWAAKRADESQWLPVTDCDRLDQALNDLESIGIVCRQNFTCCASCGEAEIGAEIQDTVALGVKVRGYAFYHAQSTDAAVAGHGVMLAYGAVERGKEATATIGREIVKALTARGLRPVWDGDPAQCVHLPIVWQRRLFCE